MAKSQTFNLSLKLISTQFEKGINKVQAQLRTFGNFVKNTFAATSLTAFTKSIANIGGTFENQMARVQAVSNANVKQFNEMRDAALEIGKTTRYSAIEAAKGLEILTRNGLKSEAAINVLPAALNLAAANAIDLAAAGDMVTNVLNMFNKTTSHASEVADIFSQAAANSATDVNALYEAMVNAGPTAASLGLSIEETTAALMTLANQGIKGADAGSKLAQAFSKLLSPKVQEDLKAYGININSTTIKAEGLIGVLKQFKNANLGPETMVEVFGERAWRGINTLVKEVDAYERNIDTAGNSTGTASRMATEGIGNWELAVKEFKNTWQDAIINTFGKVEGMLVGIVNAGKTLINSFTSGLQPTLAVFTAILVKLSRIRQEIITNNEINKKTGKAWKTVSAGVQQAQLKELEPLRTTTLELQKQITAIDKLGGSTTNLRNALPQLIKAEQELNLTGTITENTQNRLSAAYVKASKNINLAVANTKRGTTATLTLSGAISGVKKACSSILKFFGGWPGLIITAASAIVTFLIPALTKQKKAMQAANDQFGEAQAEINKLTAKANMLINEIGGTKGLNAVIKKACELFPDFADDIKKVGKAAAESGDLKDFKKLLNDIVNGLGKGTNDSLTEKIEKAIQLFPEYKKQIKAAALEAGKTGNYDKLKKTLNDIFNGFDKKELNAQIKEAIQLFPEFRTQIEEAAKEAGKTGNYDKLKNALKDILTLQSKTMGVKAAMDQYDSYLDIWAEQMMKASNKEKKKAGLADLSKYFKDNDTPKALQRSIYKSLADMYLRGAKHSEINDYIKTATGGEVSMPSGWNPNMVGDLWKTVGQMRDWLKTADAVNDDIIAAEEELAEDVPTSGKNDPAKVDEDLKKVKEAYEKFQNEINGIKKRENAGLYTDEEDELKDLIRAYETYIGTISELKSTTQQQVNDAAAITSSYHDESLALKELKERLQEVQKEKKDWKGDISKIESTSKSGANLVEKLKKEYAKSEAREKVDRTPLDTFSLDPREHKDLEDAMSRIQNELGRLESAYASLTEEKRKEITDNIAYAQSILNDADACSKLTAEQKEVLQNSIAKDTATLVYFDDLKVKIDEASKYTKLLGDSYSLMMAKQDLADKKTEAFNSSMSVISQSVGLVENLADSFEKLADGEMDAFDVLNLIISSITTVSSIIESIKTLNNVFSGISSGKEAIDEMTKSVQTQTTAINTSAAAKQAADAQSVADEGKKLIATKLTSGAIEGQNAAQDAAAISKASSVSSFVGAEAIKTDAALTTASAEASAAAAGAVSSQAAIPIVGPALGIAAGAAVLAAVIAMIAKAKKHASGGIIQGLHHGDQQLARVNGGEMILNTQQQSRLFSMLNGRGTNGVNGGTVEFKIEGKNLKGVLSNYNSANSKIASNL